MADGAGMSGVEASSEIRRTVVATFPRSGHHLLERLVRGCYPAGAVSYCDVHQEPGRRLSACPATNLQKTHDLENDEPVSAAYQHLVQVRYPLESLASWYTMAVKANELPDTIEAWRGYAQMTSIMWLRFWKKWVLGPVPKRMIVEYAALMDDPAGTMRRVVDFLGGPAVSDGTIAGVVEAEGVRPRRAFGDFKYADDPFTEQLAGYFRSMPGVDVGAGRLDLSGLALSNQDLASSEWN